MKKTLTHILVIIFIFNCCSNDISKKYSINYNLGISFPPVSNEEQRNFSTTLLKELNVTTIRIGENWSFREPTEGYFNWNPLDERINWAFENGFKVLLTIQSNGPNWACSSQQNSNSCVFSDNAKFKKYIEILLQRYPNKISKIQFGNEWQTDFWYVGNAQEFVAASNIVYNAIQEYAPNTEFVLGGFTTISLRFLAGCNGLVDSFYDDDGTLYNQQYLAQNCNTSAIQSVVNRINFILENALYDEVDIHLYDDVENWEVYFNNIKSMVQKPIIITEFGGPNVNLEPNTDEYQAKQLELYIKEIDKMNVVEEAYFFKLVQGSNNPAHSKSGLIDDISLTKKESFSTFKKYNE